MKQMIVKIFDHKIEFYNPGKLPDSISIADLLSNNYRSTPRNKLIADFCKHVGLIEKYGSGIQRVIQQFAAQDLPTPVFSQIVEGIMVTVTDGKEEKYDTISDTIKERELTKNQQEILNAVAKNKYITALELTEVVGINLRNIRANIAFLKEKGFIQRIGSPRVGYLKIVGKE